MRSTRPASDATSASHRSKSRTRCARSQAYAPRSISWPSGLTLTLGEVADLPGNCNVDEGRARGVDEHWGVCSALSAVYESTSRRGRDEGVRVTPVVQAESLTKRFGEVAVTEDRKRGGCLSRSAATRFASTCWLPRRGAVSQPRHGSRRRQLPEKPSTERDNKPADTSSTSGRLRSLPSQAREAVAGFRC